MAFIKVSEGQKNPHITHSEMLMISSYTKHRET
jgi:hypothetical protein